MNEPYFVIRRRDVRRAIRRHRFGAWLCRHGVHAWHVVDDVEICARCGLEAPGEYWQM